MEKLINLQFTSIWWTFLVPLILMVLDILTGYYNAWKQDEVSSAKMRDGLGKKCAEICYIVIGVLAKYAVGLDPIMYFIIIYVCYMELLSLAENCDKLGFPMPKSWKKKLNNEEDK